jgi:hypothetical protein
MRLRPLAGPAAATLAGWAGVPPSFTALVGDRPGRPSRPKRSANSFCREWITRVAKAAI